MKFQVFLHSFHLWALSHGIKIILILVIAFLIDRILMVFIRRGIKKITRGRIRKIEVKRTKTLVSVFSGTSRFVIWIIALLMILPEFGINIGALLAGMSLVGLAIGMASRQIISDFISGFFIILEDQYQVGDKVNIAGIEGVVKEMTLRRTIIEDADEVLHLIPNGQITIVAKKE